MFNRIVNFFKEVRLELKKVAWPNRQDTINHTLIVIGITLAVAVFLGAMDFLLTYLINTFIL
jgi:preprotein translocase subunit SecE